MTTYLQTRAIIAPVKLAHWLPIWNKSCCHMSSFHLFQPSQLSRTFNIQKKEDLSSVFKLFSILVIFFSFFPSHTTSLSEKGKPSRPAPLRACAGELGGLGVSPRENIFESVDHHHQSPSITINHHQSSKCQWFTHSIFWVLVHLFWI